MYNVLDYGLEADGTTDNTATLRSLVTIVLAAGGGTIYFPSGVYSFAIGEGSDKTTLVLDGIGDANLRFLGEGRSSTIHWGGDAGTADAHFMQFKDGVRYVTVEGLHIVQKNLTNPDPSEQHRFFDLTTKRGGNNEFFRFLNCDFGVIKGDVFRCTGGLNPSACKTGIAGTLGTGAVAGPFTSPTRPQRIVVGYPQNWDGGSFTITGTDIQDLVVSETIPALPPPAVPPTHADAYISNLEFKTVTGVTKNATGTTSDTATIGFAYEIRHVTIRDCYFDGFEYAGTDPNYGYRSCIVAQRLSRYINVLNNYMTGSSDQLIDFEPTGNGNLGPWTIEGNTIIAANPRSGRSLPGLVVTLWGNGNVTGGGSLLNERSSFSRNHVVGRIAGGKMSQVKIEGNWLTSAPNDSALDGLIAIAETNEDVDICGNVIVMSAILGRKPISVAGVIEQGVREYPARGIRVNDNTVFWYNGAAITLERCLSAECRGNRLVYLGSQSADDDAIIITAISTNISRIAIEDNTIEGERGGGTIRYGVAYNPGSGVNANVTIRGNRGTGVATRGVSLSRPEGGGSYTTIPIVMENDFPGASTPLFLGSGVVALVAGNAGSAGAAYISAANDPGSITELSAVVNGAMYHAPDGKLYARVNGAWSLINGTEYHLGAPDFYPAKGQLVMGIATADWSLGLSEESELLANIPLEVGKRIKALTYYYSRGGSGTLRFRLYKRTANTTTLLNTVTVNSGSGWTSNTSTSINYTTEAGYKVFLRVTLDNTTQLFSHATIAY